MKRNTSKKEYAVCVDNIGYEASLEHGKIYQVLPCRTVDHGYLRVVDESAEDYLFDSERFFPITISQKLETALQSPQVTKSSERTRARAIGSDRSRVRR